MSEICVDDIQTMVMVAEDKARKQGALEELDLIRLRIDELWRNEALDFNTASKIKLIIYNRKEELSE